MLKYFGFENQLRGPPELCCSNCNIGLSKNEDNIIYNLLLEVLVKILCLAVYATCSWFCFDSFSTLKLNILNTTGSVPHYLRDSEYIVSFLSHRTLPFGLHNSVICDSKFGWIHEFLEKLSGIKVVDRGTGDELSW
ncbi:hypothetical protein KUTeg_017769, partial [Tegillarca granosa]